MEQLNQRKSPLRQVSKEDRDEDAASSTRNMKSSTFREKVQQKGLKPLHPLHNLDLITFGLSCALMGAAIALFFLEKYVAGGISLGGFAALLPFVLIQANGDLGKAFKLLLAEIFWRCFKLHLDLKKSDRDFRVKEDGLMFTIYKRLSK